MMRARRTVLTVLSMAAALPWVAGSTTGGCNTVMPLSAGTGDLRILITDKPFPFEFIEQALVTVERVEVRPAGSDAEDGETDAGFITLLEVEGGREFNLLELQNGRVDVLLDAELPAGRYTQFRFIVTQEEVHLRDGRVFTLRVPSGEQTGIKLRCDLEINPEEQATLLLDVDLSRAFSPVPGTAVKDPDEIRGFHFKPSLALRLVRLDESGSVTGVVQDSNGFPVPFVSVTAFTEEGEVSSTATGEDGVFTLIGLPAETCKLEFSADGYGLEVKSPVSVKAGLTTDIGSITLQPASRPVPAAAVTPPAEAPLEVNHALGRPVTLHGPFFSTQYYSGTASDPQTVVDGIFLPRRTTWDRGTVWWVMVGGFQNGQHLTVDLGGPRQITSVSVQTNSKEAYVLSYWDLESHAWVAVWSIPAGAAASTGMETRPDPADNSARHVLANPIVTDRLKLAGAATSGTHLYSVSEIQAYGPVLNSPPVADAGGPYVVRATSWNGGRAMLDGGRSNDPDGEMLLYAWELDHQEIGDTARLEWEFPVGTSEVSLTVTDPSGLSETAVAKVQVSAGDVRIDIRPGEEPNSVNPKAKGVLPVAFLTDENCDATGIDPSTVSFPGYAFGGFVRMHGKGKSQPQAERLDVDGDGDIDLVVHLETTLLPLISGVTQLTLGALTWEGFLVQGSDSVKVVPR